MLQGRKVNLGKDEDMMVSLTAQQTKRENADLDSHVELQQTLPCEAAGDGRHIHICSVERNYSKECWSKHEHSFLGASKWSSGLMCTGYGL